MHPSIPKLPALAEHFLPHSTPMVYIDRLMEADGDRGRCETILRKGHMLLDASGCMERSGFIELGAQAFAAHKGFEFICQGMPCPIGYLVGIQGFECLGDAHMGDRLCIDTECLGTFEGFGVVRAVIRRDDTVLAQGKIKLYVPAPDDHDIVAGG
ncbi:MAG: 3-hydroxylacyl-ACP dehydratase [Desulfoplanes sp.]|nr:3-hydroxylacyl-ACP dehydratase [Desulfoplanes sp.]